MIFDSVSAPAFGVAFATGFAMRRLTGATLAGAFFAVTILLLLLTK